MKLALSIALHDSIAAALDPSLDAGDGVYALSDAIRARDPPSESAFASLVIVGHWTLSVVVLGGRLGTLSGSVFIFEALSWFSGVHNILCF